jgi:uncharacterized membrane protein
VEKKEGERPFPSNFSHGRDLFEEKKVSHVNEKHNSRQCKKKRSVMQENEEAIGK